MDDIFERKIKRIGADSDGKIKRIPILRPKTTIDGTYFFLETFGKTGESYKFGKTVDVVIYSNASVGRLFHNGIACESIDNKLIRFPSSEVFGTQIPRSCSDCTRRFMGKEEKAEYVKTHNTQPTVCQRGIRYYVGVIAKNRIIPAYIDMTFLRAKEFSKLIDSLDSKDDSRVFVTLEVAIIKERAWCTHVGFRGDISGELLQKVEDAWTTEFIPYFSSIKKFLESVEAKFASITDPREDRENVNIKDILDDDV